MLVCREWRWISWTRSRLFHHGLALSSLIFFLVLFWVSRWVFSVLGPSSSPSSSLLLLFIQSAFSLVFFCFFLVAIFLSKIVWFLLHPVVGMFSCHSLPIFDRIFFRCFGKSCFVCIVLPFVNTSLIFLLWPELVYFLKLYCYFFRCWLFLFSTAYFSATLFFIILACFRIFFICVSSRISHPGFDCSCFLRGSQFSHKLILHQHRLVHLTRLYYLLVCKVVCDLFYPFLSEEFSILCFLMKVE